MMLQSRPIFQMAVIEDKQNLSLIFSSELKNDSSQNFVYCIPIEMHTDEDSLVKNLINSTIVLPFAVENDVSYIEGNIDFPFINFDLSKYDIQEKIRFIVHFYNRDKEDYFELPKRKKFKLYFKYLNRFLRQRNNTYNKRDNVYNLDFVTLKYTGNWNKIEKNNTKFLILRPMNLNQIDLIYKKFKIIPVGFTPNFGNY